MTVQEAYQDYVILRLQGHTEQEAYLDLATYLHPITLAKLKAHVKAMSPKSKPPRATATKLGQP